MRDYGKVSPQFWTGKTGKALRGDLEAQVVAMYLMTSPHANMIGVYHLPMLYLSHETGLTPEGASKGLAKCVELGFCVYDEDSETVFVVEMAAHQVGEELKETDNRVKSVVRQFKTISSSVIADAFHARYGEPFNLESPYQAPSKGLGKGLQKPPSPAPAPAPALVPVVKAESSDATAILSAYHKILPSCQAVAVLGPKRERRIAEAAKQARKVCREQGWPYDPHEFWTAYFTECAADEWLRGDKPNPNNPTWRQKLDTLIDETRFTQVMDRAIAAMRGAQ